MDAKAKESTVPTDGGEDPVFTYRHLLTDKLGVLDPFRVVALCDLDAFYAAAERVRLNLDPEIPLAVQQWQGLIAVNYPARKFGISRMETVQDAKKKCPELQLVHVATYKEGETEAGYWPNPSPDTHKVSLDHYRRESMKILNLHRQYMPTDVEVEKASIDEAFFDFTTPVKHTILSRWPHLSIPPANSLSGGLDSPLPDPPPINWNGLGSVVDVIEQDSSESVELETPLVVKPNLPITWHDVALSIGAELMLKSRLEVKKQLGYTTSAGIAKNKMLAKLVASYRKPDQQSVLRNGEISSYLRPMPFQKIRFLGGKLGDAMADEFGVKTVGDVLTVGLGEMQSKLGEESYWVYNVLRGIDHSEVKERLATKSMLASKNTRPNLTTKPQVLHWLRVLASELSVRLLEARDLVPTIWPKTLVLHLRQGFGSTKSKQSSFPFSNVVTPEIVLKPAEKLFAELCGNAPFRIDNISLAFAGLTKMEAGQKGIVNFLGTGTSSAQERLLEPSTGSKRKRSQEPDGDDMKEPAERSAASSDTYTCPRCRKVLSLPRNQRETDMTEALSKLRTEHEDFHVAQDLAREVIDDGPNDPRLPHPSRRTDIRKKPPAKDITSFFQKR